MEKSAQPTRIVESGEVTYTYEVTNTGDVPLAGVAESIEDDTCEPVRYVRGDTDGDGLLDTPDSIFEDEADEKWVFECTTTVDEDTTNVVVVAGSPSDEDGNPLCGAGSEAQIAPCDVRDRDRATVIVVAGPAIGPGEGAGGGSPGGDFGDLGDTGAPRGLYQLLVLGLLLLLAGSAMSVAGHRRRGVAV